MKRILFFLLAIYLQPFPATCQLVPVAGVEKLKKSYSGQVEWDEAGQTLKFITSGMLRFADRQDFKESYWGVPPEIKKIVIGKNVTVVGHFHVRNTLEVSGEDRKTSKVYGTPISELLRQHQLDARGGTVPYSAFFGVGDFELHINNLTSLNPIGFHFTGKEGCVIHLENVDAIDDRGGWHNHSDGISAAGGSTVKNCFFSSGDDIIKVYQDIYVENTTIEMIQNCVPIQFGWGSYGSGARGKFKNLVIKGDKGRPDTGNAIIDARRGTYDKELEFDGLVIDAPNSVFINFWNENTDGSIGGGFAKISVDHADIKVQHFSKRWNMEARVRICGEEYDKTSTQNQVKCD